MNNYSKLEVKGKGSYGAAYLAIEKQSNEQFIIKIIDTALMDGNQKENAINEAKILRELKHPSIIRYHESFIDKVTNLCIVMEYAENGNLEQRMVEYKNNNEYINEQQIIDWFVQVCLAIKYLHDQNIIHRDIKTQNIFINKNNFIKLGDFGIAKVVECKEQLCKTSIGTPYYISPEAFQSKPYNHKSDMWSLGCVLYELMALRHAFDAKSRFTNKFLAIEGLGIKILRGQYPMIPKHYSEELKSLVPKLLTVDPQKRLNINQLLKQDILKRAAKKFLAKIISTEQKAEKVISNSIANKIEELKIQLENELGFQKLQQLMDEIENDTLNFNTDFSDKTIKQIENLLSLEKQLY